MSRRGSSAACSLLPLLLEDGVFSVAEWFVSVSASPALAFLVAGVAFTASLGSGPLYYTDVQSPGAVAVRARPPPARQRVADLADLRRRMMILWDQIDAGDPRPMGAVGRITSIWAVSFEAALGDILPSERGQTSRGLLDSLIIVRYIIFFGVN